LWQNVIDHGISKKNADINDPGAVAGRTGKSVSEGTAQPTREGAESPPARSAGAVEPAETAAKPVEPTAERGEPAEAAAKPVERAAEPVEPAEAAAKPVARAAEPVEPAEAAAEPEEPTEPAPSAESVEDRAVAKAKPSMAKSSSIARSSKRPARRAPSARTAALFRAFRSRRPVDGHVQQVIKGGYEIKLRKARGFCPHSQMDLLRVDDPEAHVGKSYAFRIMQIRRGGEDVVLSRRALLEEERRDEASAVRATLVEGSVMLGRVAGTTSYGAFVDLGAGVMGLVHASELSHGHVRRVEDVVREGERVRVKILRADDSTGRISLSLRQAQDDPWKGVAQRFPTDSVHSGTVRRVTDFGAFVELADGVEALAPASEMPPRQGGWGELLQPGHSRDWLVLSVDAARRRICVTPIEEGFEAVRREALEVGAARTGRVQRVERFGVFVWLAPGRVGLMPASWTGTPRGTDLGRAFSVGAEVEVVVVELSEEGRRIRLTRKGVEIEAKPPRATSRPRGKKRAPVRDEPTPVSEPESPFGSVLADKLKAALGRIDESS
jgi:small subunit ribosomal protein S1